VRLRLSFSVIGNRQLMALMQMSAPNISNPIAATRRQKEIDMEKRRK
jgi:hypothetical protein